MKRILTLGLLAVVAALGTSRSADAWTNCKFSIGLNWSCQSGNNNLFWGLWHNGQVPEYDGYGGGHGPGPNALPPGYGPAYPPGTQPFPYFGTNHQQQQMNNMPTAASNYSTSYYHQASYQPSSTPATYTPSYYSPSYYAPGYSYPGYYPGYGDGFSWFTQR